VCFTIMPFAGSGRGPTPARRLLATCLLLVLALFATVHCLPPSGTVACTLALSSTALNLKCTGDAVVSLQVHSGLEDALDVTTSKIIKQGSISGCRRPLSEVQLPLIRLCSPAATLTLTNSTIHSLSVPDALSLVSATSDIEVLLLEGAGDVVLEDTTVQGVAGASAVHAHGGRSVVVRSCTFSGNYAPDVRRLTSHVHTVVCSCRALFAERALLAGEADFAPQFQHCYASCPFVQEAAATNCKCSRRGCHSTAAITHDFQHKCAAILAAS
jgi:hypothetical protein